MVLDNATNLDELKQQTDITSLSKEMNDYCKELLKEDQNRT